jgi:adenosine deaminase/adenosine deaminase CECR1
LFIIVGEINLKPVSQFNAPADAEPYSGLKSVAVVFLAAVFIFSGFISLAEGRCATDQAVSDEMLTSQRLEALRQNPEELRAFFLSMPKGGDIHNHLTGAVYAEHLIDEANAQNLCINLDNYTVSPNYCGSNNSEPIKNAYSNSKLYGQIVDAWSMRDSEVLDESKRDHFFNTFGVFGGATSNVSDILANLRSDAFRENVSYLEIMTGAGSAAANLGSKAGWNDNFTLFYGKLIENGLFSVSQSLSDYINDTERLSLDILENRGDPGKRVTVRYILSATRTMPRERVFGQLAAAFDAASRSSLAVGVTLLSPEDNYIARENYSLQMRMVQFLHSIYPDVNIALHAGELNLGLVPTEDLRFHIKEAVEIAHASRIGHGVDIMWELDSEQVLKEMAQNGVAIEIMPVSNKVILGVSGEDHPFPVYFKRGVPIVLASDDAGVLRTDLSEQFVIIASDYPQIKYQDFKRFVRNSIEYSFLQGKSIWQSKGDYYKLIPECTGCSPGSSQINAKCKAFLDGSEKATVQWKLEGDLAAFEKRYVMEEQDTKFPVLTHSAPRPPEPPHAPRILTG